MSRTLTPYEEETIEQNITEMFAFEQDNIAADLGIKRQPDGHWSDEDGQRIIDEVSRRYREGFIRSLS
jgi:hypothetical protein